MSPEPAERGAQPLRGGVGTPEKAALLFTLLPLAIYTWGACRTIYVGDSGELVTAAVTLGIPHPSGYPLYVLAGWLVTRLGNLLGLTPAHAMSLFSAATAALTVGLLHWLIERATRVRVAAVVGASLLAFSPSFWSQATIQRVYSLNALFVVASLALVWLWLQSRFPRSGDRYLIAASFVAALGATNHTAMAVVGLCLGLGCLAVEPKLWRRSGLVLRCVGAGVAGLLPYLYLPLRSRQNPRLDWGDPETLERWLEVLLRRDFWYRRWYDGPTDLVPITADWLASHAVEFYGIGAILGWLGLVVAPRYGWPRGLPALLGLGNLLALAGHGSRADLFVWHRYYIPTYVALGLLAGLGAAYLLHRGSRWWRPVLLLLPIPLIVAGWNRFDRHDYRFVEDFTRSLLATVPEGARLSAGDDVVLFALLYHHLALGERPDLELILEGGGSARPVRLAWNLEDEPIFFTHPTGPDTPGVELLPVGLLWVTVEPGEEPALRLPSRLELPQERETGIPRDYLTDNLIAHFHYMLGMTHERLDWPRAMRHWQRATEFGAEDDLLFFNLGQLFWRNGQPERALAAFRRAAEINPRHLMTPDRVEPSQRVRDLEREVTWVRNLEAELARRSGLAGPPTNAEQHRAFAAELERAGVPLLAHGHRLQAQELEAFRPAE